MLEKAGRAEAEVELHGGAGRTGVQWYFRERTSLPVAIQRWRIPPGGSEGMHTHPRSGDDALEEVYVLLDGEAVMIVDGERRELTPGDAVLAPAGTAHDIANPGTRTAVVMIVFGAPGAVPDWTGLRTWRATAEAERAERDATQGSAPAGEAR